MQLFHSCIYKINAAQQHSGLPVGGRTDTQSVPTYIFQCQHLTLCLQATVTALTAAVAVATAHGMLLLLQLKLMGMLLLLQLKLMACCC